MKKAASILLGLWVVLLTLCVKIPTLLSGEPAAIKSRCQNWSYQDQSGFVVKMEDEARKNGFCDQGRVGVYDQKGHQIFQFPAGVWGKFPIIKNSIYWDSGEFYESPWWQFWHQSHFRRTLHATDLGTKKTRVIYQGKLRDFHVHPQALAVSMGDDFSISLLDLQTSQLKILYGLDAEHLSEEQANSPVYEKVTQQGWSKDGEKLWFSVEDIHTKKFDVLAERKIRIGMYSEKRIAWHSIIGKGTTRIHLDPDSERVFYRSYSSCAKTADHIKCQSSYFLFDMAQDSQKEISKIDCLKSGSWLHPLCSEYFGLSNQNGR